MRLFFRRSRVRPSSRCAPGCRSVDTKHPRLPYIPARGSLGRTEVTLRLHGNLDRYRYHGHAPQLLVFCDTAYGPDAYIYDSLTPPNPSFPNALHDQPLRICCRLQNLKDWSKKPPVASTVTACLLIPQLRTWSR